MELNSAELSWELSSGDEHAEWASSNKGEEEARVVVVLEHSC